MIHGIRRLIFFALVCLLPLCFAAADVPHGADAVHSKGASFSDVAQAIIKFDSVYTENMYASGSIISYRFGPYDLTASGAWELTLGPDRAALQLQRDSPRFETVAQLVGLPTPPGVDPDALTKFGKRGFLFHPLMVSIWNSEYYATTLIIDEYVLTIGTGDRLVQNPIGGGAIIEFSRPWKPPFYNQGNNPTLENYLMCLGRGFGEYLFSQDNSDESISTDENGCYVMSWKTSALAAVNLVVDPRADYIARKVSVVVANPGGTETKYVELSSDGITQGPTGYALANAKLNRPNRGFFLHLMTDEIALNFNDEMLSRCALYTRAPVPSADSTTVHDTRVKPTLSYSVKRNGETTVYKTHRGTRKSAASNTLRSERAVEIAEPQGVFWLEELYDFPICSERLRIRDMESKSDAALLPKFQEPFLIEKDEILLHVLDRLVKASDGRAKWRFSNDVAYLAPKVSDDTVEQNVMERRISVPLNSLSAWESLREVARVVNSSAEAPRIFAIVPPGTDRTHSHKPPAAFLEEKTITLRLENVTVRDAVTQIFQASSFPMSYHYFPAPIGHDGADRLMLSFLTKGISNPPTEEDEAFWKAEFQRMDEVFSASRDERHSNTVKR
ncbi:MAG: hypothetical protein SGI88_05455 [Candidatus Hydrogenedentes bacterium]|nr:hypothetical protein [Candidatus Hydrogenedentota bacterium]